MRPPVNKWMTGVEWRLMECYWMKGDNRRRRRRSWSHAGSDASLPRRRWCGAATSDASRPSRKSWARPGGGATLAPRSATVPWPPWPSRRRPLSTTPALRQVLISCSICLISPLFWDSFRVLWPRLHNSLRRPWDSSSCSTWRSIFRLVKRIRKKKTTSPGILFIFSCHLPSIWMGVHQKTQFRSVSSCSYGIPPSLPRVVWDSAAVLLGF